MFRWILIIVLAVLLFFQSRDRDVKNIITVKTDTVISIKTFTKHSRGQDIKQILLDTIYKTDYDTIEIIRDYQQAKEFTDSIRQDSNLFVITDTVSNNKIVGRSFKAQIQEKTIIITNNIEREPNASLYLGIRSDVRRDLNKVDHNVTLNLKSSKRGLFSVGLGTGGVSLGYAIKLL
jgi:hypothetical protein